MRANFAIDNPIFDKASMLGGKTDMQNKKMIKYGIIAMGFAVALIVVWLMIRVSSQNPSLFPNLCFLFRK